MDTCKLLLLAVTSLVLLTGGDAWWMKNNERHTFHACGAALEVFVGDTCKTKWYQNCGTDSCRRRRDLEAVIAKEEGAKAFLRARRTKRAIWSLYEECCKEGCSNEEVREHC